MGEADPLLCNALVRANDPVADDGYEPEDTHPGEGPSEGPG
jgi:hypothetical protein